MIVVIFGGLYVENAEMELSYVRDVLKAVEARNNAIQANKGDSVRITFTLDRDLSRQLDEEKKIRFQAVEVSNVSAIVRDALAFYFRLKSEANARRGVNAWARDTGVDSDKDMSWKR